MDTKIPTIKVSFPLSLRQSTCRSFLLDPVMVLAALLAFCPVDVRADTIALSFTGGAPGFTQNGTLGWGFSVGNPITITQLGVWDENNDGLGQSYQVSVWTSAGALKAQTVVPAGTSATLADGFRYFSVSATPLPVGDYVISVFYPSTFADRFSSNASSVNPVGEITYDDSRSWPGDVFPPGDVLSTPNSYFGPNFQFVRARNVPDASPTWTLFLLGIVATFGLQLLLGSVPSRGR
jgi:hypothetical protein